MGRLRATVVAGALVLGAVGGLGVGRASATDGCAPAHADRWTCSPSTPHDVEPEGPGATVEDVCRLLGERLAVCAPPNYEIAVSAGFLPYNPASGEPAVVVFDNSVYCDPGDTATGEVRVSGLPEGYTYETGQSPDNPSSVFVAITRPPTDYDYTKQATEADLIRFAFAFDCRDDAAPHRGR